MQQQLLGHRGRKHDPLYRIRNALRVHRQAHRPSDSPHLDRPAGRRPDLRGHRCLELLPTAAIRVRHTQPHRRPHNRGAGARLLPPLPYPRDRPPRPDAGRLATALPRLLHHRAASNGGTKAINGIIELHRRIARDFRNPTSYRLRVILAAGKLAPESPISLYWLGRNSALSPQAGRPRKHDRPRTPHFGPLSH